MASKISDDIGEKKREKKKKAGMDAAASVELLEQSETANRRCKHISWPNVQVSRP